MAEPRHRALTAHLPPGGAGAEIGVLDGDSAAAILAAVRPRRLLLVDPWRAAEEVERSGALYAVGSGRDMDAAHAGVLARFAEEIAGGRVEVLRGTVAQADAAVADAALDFVHVDGDHREAAVTADLDFAFRKLAPGGVVVLDDYHLGGWWGDGVHRAAHRFLGGHAGALEIVAAPADRLVIRRR